MSRFSLVLLNAFVILLRGVRNTRKVYVMSKVLQFYGSCKDVIFKPLEFSRPFHIFMT